MSDIENYYSTEDESDTSSVSTLESDVEENPTKQQDVFSDEESILSMDDIPDDVSDLQSDEEENTTKKKKQSAGRSTVDLPSDDDGDDDDDMSSDNDESEIYDVNANQKLTFAMNKNNIINNHPECIGVLPEAVIELSKVVRDEYNNIIDPNHKTIPILTKYEKAAILGFRANQIENGSKPYIDIPENIIDSITIAEMELKEKAPPHIIRRPLPNGKFEYWKLEDLKIIS